MIRWMPTTARSTATARPVIHILVAMVPRALPSLSMPVCSARFRHMPESFGQTARVRCSSKHSIATARRWECGALTTSRMESTMARRRKIISSVYTTRMAFLQVIDLNTADRVAELDCRNAILVVYTEEIIFRRRAIVDSIREVVRAPHSHRRAVAIECFEEHLTRAVCPNDSGMCRKRAEHTGIESEGNARGTIATKI